MFVPLIVLFLGLAHAQHRCCGPAQWEAYFGQLEGYYDEKTHHPGIISGLDKVHYDFPNKRMVTQTNLIVDGAHPFNGTIYNDYNQMKQFIHNGKNCTVATMEAPMLSNCITAGANFSGSTYFGTGSSKLMLDLWQINYSGTRVSLAMTQNGCYLVSEGIIGEFGNGGTFSQCKTPGQCVDALLAFGITGMTVGIKDVSVFSMPDICTTTLESHDPIDALSIGHQLHEIRRRYA